MNKYESVFIIKPDLNEENLKSVLAQVEDEVKKNKGTVAEVKEWGKRRLAYNIKRFDEGVYYQIDFDITPDALKDMHKKFHLNENILRFMIIKKGEAQ